MVTNKISEGVGKKIVEALKQQSEIEIQNVVESSQGIEEESNSQEVSNIENTTHEESTFVHDYTDEKDLSYSSENNFETPQMFSSQSSMNYNQLSPENYSNDLEGFDLPANVVVLRQLINQLPAGVSKQTGAQIIKQTMEALGISMKNVLQEAQQVQENLNNSAKECQASIIEYRKQINMLERQSQKFQRQYAELNDVISLFIQTSI